MSMWGSLDAIQATHVDPDERKYGNQLTFGAMHYATEQIFSCWVTACVFDLQRKHRVERDEKHEIARKFGAIRLWLSGLKYPHELALQRVQQREEAHDQRRISAEKAEAGARTIQK